MVGDAPEAACQVRVSAAEHTPITGHWHTLQCDLCSVLTSVHTPYCSLPKVTTCALCSWQRPHRLAYPPMCACTNNFLPSRSSTLTNVSKGEGQGEARSRHLLSRCVCGKGKAVGAVSRIGLTGLGSRRYSSQRLLCTRGGRGTNLYRHAHQWLISQTWAHGPRLC